MTKSYKRLEADGSENFDKVVEESVLNVSRQAPSKVLPTPWVSALLTPEDYASVPAAMIETAKLISPRDGGCLRKFRGGLTHENGWYASAKTRRFLYWEGMTQFDAIRRAECDDAVIFMMPEPRRFRFFLDDQWVSYTADLELHLSDGRKFILELKREADDLRDQAYRRTLAAVSNCCAAIGYHFRIVLADQIFASREHRYNVDLFASRRFVNVDRSALSRLRSVAADKSIKPTWGNLVRALDPANHLRGAALAQAFVCQRKVKLDLRELILDYSPISFPTQA